MKNYYELLEVSKNASSEIINKVYKFKIKQNHPDLFQGEEKLKAEEITKELTEAYNILSNEEKRKEYDASLEENDPKLKQLTNINEMYKQENEILRAELAKKNQLISTYLSSVNLNDYNDYSNGTKNENSSSKKDSLFSNLLNNSSESQENNPDIPFYKYTLHTLKDILLKILAIFVFVILGIILLSVITKTNAFEVIFKTFSN